MFLNVLFVQLARSLILLRRLDARNVPQELLNPKESLALNVLQEVSLWKQHRINLNVLFAQLVQFPLMLQVHA